ncbi:unnamed protein product [Allacma fusca]|uniref:BHLH domain-containing protein n=1 Tax=Allacma fusca TaxID=39272 RepID=A0A8J2JJH7_9HEXA|nr:unnamed protein product [Allacma fusca]
MHSSVGIATMNCTSESPTNTSYSEYGWCGPSSEDNYNENYLPSDPISHSAQVINPYYEYHPHSGHHSFGNNSSEVDDCCSGSGPEYGYGSRSPSGSAFVWDCPASHHGNPSPSPMTSPADCNGRPEHRPVKRRTTANKKERRRTQSINNAFAELRDCIPNVPADTKLSKIKTLRLATSYIAYLSEVLSGDDPSRTPAAFTAEISRKLARGDEKRKKELLMAELSAVTGGGTGAGTGGASANNNAPVDRKPKGRTGWPQHVWALELQQ